nr:hypothetical protein [Tanacetum cinerariifolium]
MMRQNKNLMDINIDALYNILKQNQGDVNDAMGSKKKTVVVTSDLLALIADKTNVSRSKEKVVVSLDSEGSEANDFSELKKITALLVKAFNRRKFYSKATNNNLRTSSSSQSANKKQEFVKIDYKKVEKKDDEKKRDMSRVKCYKCKKEGHLAKDCKKAKVKDYEYYKTKMLLVKKDKDEQVLLAEDQAWMESSSDLDQEINANMVFMAQIEKVLSDSEASSSSADEKIFETKVLLAKKDSDEQVLLAKDQVWMESSSDSDQEINADIVFMAQIEKEEIYEYMIRYSALCDNDKQHKKKINEQEILFDKISCQLVEMNNNVLRLQEKILEKETKILELEGCISNKDVEIEKCLKRLNECENKLHKIGQTNQTIHMIMPSKDTLYNDRKGIGFENPIYFGKAKDLRLILYDEKVIGLGHSKLNKDVKRYSCKDLLSYNNSHLGETSCAYVCNDAMNVSCNSRLCDSFDENSSFIFDDESVRISPVSKIPFRKKPRDSLNVRSKHNSNQSLPRTVHRWLPKVQLLAETIAKWIPKVKHCPDLSLDHRFRMFKAYDENQSENDRLVVEKECDKEENPKVIAPGMFKLNVLQCVSQISMSKSSCDSNNVEIKLKRKRLKRKSSKQNVKQVNNDVLRANSDFVHFSDLDTFSSVRRPKNSGVIWKKKLSSNTFNVDLTAVSVSNLNKNVKRYSRKDLLACNNSHLGETRNAFVCNDVMNVSCDSRMNDLLDDNNFFIFDNESVKISPVSKMPF